MSELQKLRDQRAQVVTEMRSLHETAEKEERGFTTDEDAKWAKQMADLDAIDQRIQRAEKIGDLLRVEPGELRAAGKFLGGEPGATDEAKAKAEEKRVFDRFLRVGMGELSAEERQIMSGRRDTSKELRAFAAGTGNVGGYTVPQDFRDQLEVALKQYGGMIAASDVMRTDTGATLPMPTFNYTGVVATIVGEGSGGSNDSATPFGVANLGAYTYRSPILPVSFEFLQDSAFGEGFIIQALTESLGRGLNAHLTTGDGSSKPRGVVLDAVSGKTGLTGQTASIILDDLIDLEHSIDPAYRAFGCKWMMHDSSFKVIRKLKDTSNRPIFLPGFDGLGSPGPDTILGYPLAINQDVATMAANAKSVLFGRFDKYKTRMVKDITILRLTERYADNLQVGFILFMRADGRLLDAGTNPVKYYQNSAT